MLHINDLVYRVQGAPLFEQATVAVNKGERVGLVGRNGSGKTTLLKLIMTREQAEGFYAVRKERPFFNDLCTFMTSGPVVVQVLEGENAIAKNREVMGATNPKDAAPGTIRADFAESIEANSVHGSDAPETAAQEIKFFFTEAEIVG